MTVPVKAKNRWERLGLAPATVVASHRPGSIQTAKPPSQLRLSEVTLDTRLRVRAVDEDVARDYADDIDELPPVTVWLLGELYLLVNGWHRYRAHQLAGATCVRVVVMTGSYQQAMLYVAGADRQVGVRRTRETKRAAVLLVLSTPNGANWSDRDVAKHCGVSHTFVAQLRRHGAPQTSDKVAENGNAPTQKDARGSSVSKVNGNVAHKVDGQEPIAAKPSGNVATLDEQDSAGSALKDRGESPSLATAAPRKPSPLLAREVEVTQTDSSDIDAARRRLRGEDVAPPTSTGLETFHVGVPRPAAQMLKRLATDMAIDVEDAILEGVFLLLRYHQRAEGMLVPSAPVEATDDGSERGGSWRDRLPLDPR